MSKFIYHHRFDERHHMTITSRAGGRTRYAVWRETGTDSRRKIFSTACKGDAIEHAREELRLYIERETRVYYYEPSTTLIAGWQVMVADGNARRFVAQCEESEALIIVDALNKARLSQAGVPSVAPRDQADALLAAHDVRKKIERAIDRLEQVRSSLDEALAATARVA